MGGTGGVGGAGVVLEWVAREAEMAEVVLEWVAREAEMAEVARVAEDCGWFWQPQCNACK